MTSVPAHLPPAGFPKKEIVKRGETRSVYDLTDQVLKNLELLRIDYLIAVGGDDTLSYAAALNSRGVKVIAIPKTMDNDVRNTEYCIGCSTAMTRATTAIQTAADDRGLPRAHRGVPDLRSRLRIHGALHRVRDRDPLRHPGVPVQPREDRSTSCSRTNATTPATTPRRPFRGRHAGTGARCRDVGEAGRLRPPPRRSTSGEVFSRQSWASAARRPCSAT